MEIKVGEWVRTKDGCIFKATDYWIYDCEVKTENIVSHSKNIIDLIECGDYVNGMKVCKINEPSLANDYKRIVYCNESEGLYEGIFINDDIKSILTKQQMEAIQYVVE